MHRCIYISKSDGLHHGSQLPSSHELVCRNHAGLNQEAVLSEGRLGGEPP